MTYCTKSDVGRLRTGNEDSCGHKVSDDGAFSFFVVADGMGGQKAGEVASGMAVDALLERFPRFEAVAGDADELCCELRLAVKDANDAIIEAAGENDNKGMGTTLVCAAITADKLFVVNVGDSRAYLISENKGVQLTIDHSFVEDLVRNGHIDRAEARLHPRRNEITRALGADTVIIEDLFVYDYKAGDILLLCSDGLTRMVEDDEIFRMASSHKDATIVCKKLVEKANKNGGTDNITVVTVCL